MKRDGITLIELIFSMMIIAMVFTVVPKIIFASNKSLQISVREDGLYNAVSLLGSISKLPWDENTIQSGGEILNTGYFDCNATAGYRVGGFIGSRNCINYGGLSSSSIGRENSFYNDIDDYFDYDRNTSTAGNNKDYNLKVAVEYNSSNPNIKDINVTVTGKKKTGDFQSTFFYSSANLGYIKINKRAW